MPCYHPLAAYQCVDGSVVFTELRRFDTVRTLQLPCGQCIGCRLERSRQWAVRCVHEASLHDRNCFVTLTYDEAHLPPRGCLDYPAFQRFMKRLRKHARVPLKFYMCGEYGPLTGRPHYHVCLFGFDFDDKTYWRTSDSGERCYRSADLAALWPLGNSECGLVTFRSAAYCARYCLDKVTGDLARFHYARQDENGPYELPPEFNQMSRRPGIGLTWLERFHSDVYPHDYVVSNARECKPPKAYDRWLARRFPDVLEDIQYRRGQDARAQFQENTDARLAVKEQVTVARTQFFRREAADESASYS